MTTQLEQAARQALEALETLDCGDTYKTHNAASALRAALTDAALERKAENARELGLDYEPAQDEPQPCPYVVSTREGTHHCSLAQREPLTDDEIETLMDTYDVTSTDFARAIEAKLKEKNT